MVDSNAYFNYYFYKEYRQETYAMQGFFQNKLLIKIKSITKNVVAPTCVF
jgi:hypothetical protein